MIAYVIVELIIPPRAKQLEIPWYLFADQGPTKTKSQSKQRQRFRFKSVESKEANPYPQFFFGRIRIKNYHFLNIFFVSINIDSE